MEAATNTLRSMFPKSSAEQCVSALKTNNWDLSQTIDYMLAQTATDEQQHHQPPPPQQQQQHHIPPPPQQHQQRYIPQPPPPPPPRQEESEEDKILKEFLFLEQQQFQQQQQQQNRIPTPPPFNPTVVAKQQPPPPPPPPASIPTPSIAVVEKVEVVSNIPSQPIVHEQPKSRDISILKNISNTLKELENEVKNLVMDPKKSTNVVKQDDIINSINNNNNENINNETAENNISKEQEQEKEGEEEEREEKKEEENSNNAIPNEVKAAIDQLESLFNSSLEKTEKILNELKEEITSWKIKDNVKTFTVTVRNELSDMLSSLASYISPEPTENQILKKEEKRADLEKRLRELKAHNKQLEEERRVAIEKIENKNKQPTLVSTPPAPQFFYHDSHQQEQQNSILSPPPYPFENK